MTLILPDSLSLVAAPMVNQSDLPFRILTRKHGATLTYTQMLQPHRLLNDQQYLDFHLRDLQVSRQQSVFGSPVVVQLCGNDPEVIIKAARKVENWCDAVGMYGFGFKIDISYSIDLRRNVDLNLGCPQEHTRDGHYGAYLLGQKDWPLIENIGNAH